jgi:hypothetical protein
MMRIRRVRYTVRLMLVAVAIVGTAFGALVITDRRSASFSERARLHAEEIFGIEDEIPSDPAWDDYWMSDEPAPVANGRATTPRSCPAVDVT